MTRWKNGNVLDIGILLLVLLCVASAGVRIWERTRDRAHVETAAYRVTLFAGEIPAERAACIAAGESVYSEMGALLGTVRDVFYTPTSIHLFSNGQYYEGVFDPSQVCDLTLRAEVHGVWESGGVTCGALRLVPGAAVKMRSLRGDWTLRVLSVEEILE